jgi:hypothetical protein
LDIYCGSSCTNGKHTSKATLWFINLCFLFGLGFNSLIGDRRNYIRVAVTITISLVVWITWSLYLVGPLVMTVCVLHQDTDVVLQILQDSANAIENGFRPWIDYVEENYGLCIISFQHDLWIKIICDLSLELCESQFQTKTIFYVSFLTEATLINFAKPMTFLITNLKGLYSVK